MMRLDLSATAVGLALLASFVSTGFGAEPVIEQAPGASQTTPPAVELGTVARIDPVDVKSSSSTQSGPPPGAGAAAGSLAGGAIGYGIARTTPPGPGHAALIPFGVIGGAVAGSQMEEQQRAAAANAAADAAPTSSYYRVVVSFDNGTSRTFNYRELAGLRVGDRVRFQGGVLNRL